MHKETYYARIAHAKTRAGKYAEAEHFDNLAREARAERYADVARRSRGPRRVVDLKAVVARHCMTLFAGGLPVLNVEALDPVEGAWRRRDDERRGIC